MALATLVSKFCTNTLPQHLIVQWIDLIGVEAGSDSSSLIEITLPGLNIDEPSYRQEPRERISGVSYAIQLLCFGISCSSQQFDVRLLSINDITAINTIYDKLRYTNIDRVLYDQDFKEFVIKNQDTTLTNKLYLYIANHGIATGSINIEMIYNTAQDRIF